MYVCTAEEKTGSQKLASISNLRLFLSRWLNAPHRDDFDSPSSLPTLTTLTRLVVKWHSFLKPQSGLVSQDTSNRDRRNRFAIANSSDYLTERLIRCMFYGVNEKELLRETREMDRLFTIAERRLCSLERGNESCSSSYEELAPSMDKSECIQTPLGRSRSRNRFEPANIEAFAMDNVNPQTIAQELTTRDVALRQLKNLAGLNAVLTGLQTTAIHRLRRTWVALKLQSEMHHQHFEELSSFMTQDNNLNKLRSEIDSHISALKLQEEIRRKNRKEQTRGTREVTGMIPYLGMYTRDLTFLNVSTPDHKPAITSPRANNPNRSRLEISPPSTVNGQSSSDQPIRYTFGQSSSNKQSSSPTLPPSGRKTPRDRKSNRSQEIQRSPTTPTNASSKSDEWENHEMKPINFDKHTREASYLRDLYQLQYSTKAYTSFRSCDQCRQWLDSFPQSLSEERAEKNDVEPKQRSPQSTGSSGSSQISNPYPASLVTYVGKPRKRPGILNKDIFIPTNRSPGVGGDGSPSTSVKYCLSASPVPPHKPVTNGPFVQMLDVKPRIPPSPVVPPSPKLRLKQRSNTTAVIELTPEGSPGLYKKYNGHSVSPRARSSSRLRQAHITVRVRVRLLDLPPSESPDQVYSVFRPSVHMGSAPNLNQLHISKLGGSPSMIAEEIVQPEDSVENLLYRVLGKFGLFSSQSKDYQLIVCGNNNSPDRRLPYKENAYTVLGIKQDTLEVCKSNSYIIECVCKPIEISTPTYQGSRKASSKSLKTNRQKPRKSLDSLRF